MTEEQKIYHVIWNPAAKRAERGDLDYNNPISDRADGLEYVMCTHPTHLENVLKKHFGDKEDVLRAIAKDHLRIIEGVEIKPVVKVVETFTIGDLGIYREEE